MFNDNSPTYLHPTSGTQTAIDLSICSTSIFLDFSWQVHNDQCGSDHFPIFIDINKSLPKDNVPRWNIKKADWAQFQLCCSEELNPCSFNDVDDKFSGFMEKLNAIATKCIPKSTGQSTGGFKPWFDNKCKEAIKACLETNK